MLDEEEEEIVLKSDVDQVESDTTQSLQLDSLEIDFSRWIPDYAAHSASTLPDSLRLIGTKLAFDKLYTFFEKLESISETDTENHGVAQGQVYFQHTNQYLHFQLDKRAMKIGLGIRALVKLTVL